MALQKRQLAMNLLWICNANEVGLSMAYSGFGSYFPYKPVLLISLYVALRTIVVSCWSSVVL
jgi:hypothetical protein